MKIDLKRAVEVLEACGYECEQLTSRDAEIAELNNRLVTLGGIASTHVGEKERFREQLAAANTLIRAYREEFGKAGVSWKIDAVEPKP